MKKFLKALLLVFFLCILYAYTLVIELIPKQITIFEGEKISMKTLIGLSLKENTVETASTNQKKEKVETTNIELNLFNNIKLKDVEVNILPKTTVIPIGNIAGVKLYTNGVLVVGMSEIEGKDNKKYKPYESSGIKEGDTITKIDEEHISSTQDLISTVNKSEGKKLKIEYIHENEAKECSITPIETNTKEYKLGLWVRDSAAGVGTVTFYEPSTKTFGALGHGITDIDTE